MRNSTIVTILAVVSLAGCTATTNSVTQAEIDGFMSTLGNELSIATITPGALMPTSGQASYTGITTLAATADLGGTGFSGTIGELKLTADFSASTISGEASRFSEADVAFTATGSTITITDAVTGTLSFDNGVISGASFHSLNMTGNLTYIDGVEQYVDIDVLGDFYTGSGNEAGVIIAGGAGTTTINSVATASETEVYLIAD